MIYHQPTLDTLIDNFMKIPDRARPFLSSKGEVEIVLNVQNATLKQGITLVKNDIPKAKHSIMREGTCTFSAKYLGTGLKIIQAFEMVNERFRLKYVQAFKDGVRLESRDAFIECLEDAIRHSFPCSRGAVIFAEILV